MYGIDVCRDEPAAALWETSMSGKFQTFFGFGRTCGSCTRCQCLNRRKQWLHLLSARLEWPSGLAETETTPTCNKIDELRSSFPKSFDRACNAARGATSGNIDKIASYLAKL